MYTIPIEFATPAYDETVRLRDKILRKPLGLEFTAKEMEAEYQHIHLAAYDDQSSLLACLVLVPLENGVIKMRQVAVDEGLQSKGIGTRLVEASEVFAREQGYQKMELNARDVAIDFYEKMEYQKVGKPFTEVTIKHYKMEKVLA